MVLQDASNIILAQRLCNLSPFFLGESNATMVIVHAQSAVEIAGI